LLIIFKLKGDKQKFQQGINGQTMGKRLQKENFKFFNIGGPTSHGSLSCSCVLLAYALWQQPARAKTVLVKILCSRSKLTVKMKYTLEEYTDMIVAYGLAGENIYCAAAIYVE